jgi:opacity protein-like surface antigen
MKLCLYILICLIAVNLNAQDFPGGRNPNSNEIKNTKQSSIYAGLSVKGVNLMEDWGVELGGRFGGFLNGYFSVGAGFYYLFTQSIHYISYDSPVEPHLRLYYFGPEAEVHYPIIKKISISGFLGAYIGQVNEGIRSDIDISHDLVGDWMFSLEPGIGFYYDITDDISIGLSYQYRQSIGVDFRTLKDDDISGNTFSLSIISR